MITLSGLPSVREEFVRAVLDAAEFREAYEVVRILGAGGFGVTLLGRQRRIERPVAIKILHNMTPDSRSRFQREARILSWARHPNIVQVLDFESSDESMYMVMDFVEGEPLSRKVRPGGLPWTEVRPLILGILSALEHLHTLGILHRDLKPDNIFVEAGGRPRILDFGLGSRTPGEMEVTAQGVVLGSPAYIAPEVLAGEGYSPESDLYSVGILLHEMLTGVNPFMAETVPQVLVRQLTETIEAVTIPDPLAPPALGDWIVGLLRKEPGLRPGPASRLLEIFEDLMPRSAGNSAFLEGTMRIAPASVVQHPPPAARPPARERGGADPGELPRTLGPYEILALIGRGGMGVVYRARRAGENRLVALKAMRRDRRDDPLLVQRFRREVRIQIALRHPNLVQVLEAEAEGEIQYLVMELIEASTLRDLLEGGKPLEPKIAIPIALQIAEALHYLHGREIRHRDLKPENVFLRSDGMVKVGDFGLAVDDIGTVITQSRLGLGTPAYMAPESIVEGESGPAADLHALGVILHEMITGRPPFRAIALGELLDQVVSVTPPPLESPHEQVSEGLRRLGARLLEKAPEDRPDAREAVALLKGLRPTRLVEPVRGEVGTRSDSGKGTGTSTSTGTGTSTSRGTGTGRGTGAEPAGSRGASTWFLPVLVISITLGTSLTLWLTARTSVPAPSPVATRPSPRWTAGEHGTVEVRWEPDLPRGTRIRLRDRPQGFDRVFPHSPGGVTRLEGLGPERHYEVEIQSPGASAWMLDGTLDTPSGSRFLTISIEERQTSLVLEFSLVAPANLEIRLEDANTSRPLETVRLRDVDHGRKILSGLSPGRTYLLSLIPVGRWGGMRGIRVTTRTDRLHLDDEGQLDSLVSTLTSSPVELGRFARDLRDRKSADLALQRLPAVLTDELRVVIAGGLLATHHPRATSWVLETIASMKEPQEMGQLLHEIKNYWPRREFVEPLEARILDWNRDDIAESSLHAMMLADPGRVDPLARTWSQAGSAELQRLGALATRWSGCDGAALGRALPVLDDMGLEAVIAAAVHWESPGNLDPIRGHHRETGSTRALWARCLLADEGLAAEMADRLGTAPGGLPRLEAILALGVLGDLGAPAPGGSGRQLVTFLSADDPLISDAAAWALGRLRARDAIPELARRVTSGKDGDGAAAWALGELEAAGEAPALRAHLEALARKADPADLPRAAMLCWTLGRFADSGSRELLEKLRRENPWLEAGSRWADRALARMGSRMADHFEPFFLFTPPIALRSELDAGQSIVVGADPCLVPPSAGVWITASLDRFRNEAFSSTSKPQRVFLEASGRLVARLALDQEPTGERAALERRLAARTQRGFVALRVAR